MFEKGCLIFVVEIFHTIRFFFHLPLFRIIRLSLFYFLPKKTIDFVFDRLFGDCQKMSNELKKELEEENVQLFSYEDFYQQLKNDVQTEDSSHKFCVDIQLFISVSFSVDLFSDISIV